MHLRSTAISIAIGAIAAGALAGSGGATAAVEGTAAATRAVAPTGCAVNADGSAVPGDLTGNGKGHAVVGLPSRNQIEDIGPGGVRWHLTETHTNVAAVSDPAIGFGASVLLANVNADRCVDLIVGAPHTGRTVKDRGAVDLLLMTPTLPQTTTVVRIDGPQAGALFGSSLALTQHGDVRDLWVGAPGYSTAAGKGIGAVLRYTIAPGGSPVLAQTILDPDPVAGDHFGAVLDSGTGLTSTADPSHRDAFVMVGTPDKTVVNASLGPQAGAGEVEWIRSLDTTGAGSIATTLNQDRTTASPERGDHFGASIAAGNVGEPTLIGTPGEDVQGIVDAGLLGYTYLTADATRPFLRTTDQTKYDVAGIAETGDQFAASVLIDWTVRDVDGYYLALVGVPGEDIGSVKDAGQVQRFWFPDNAGFNAVELTPVLAQGGTQLRDRAEAGDRVGASLSLRVADGGSLPAGILTPVIGVPGESGATAPGAGIVSYATDAAGQAPWRLSGYSGGAVTGLHYGAVLARVSR